MVGPDSQREQSYPWWEVTTDSALQQGDLLKSFKVVYPTGTSKLDGDTDSLEAAEGTFDLIVMTQSCDIGERKVTSILLCPWWNLWEWVNARKASGENWGRDQREKLRQGLFTGYHLLNDWPSGEVSLGLGIVDFRQVYTAPLDIIRQYLQNCPKRLRLLPPYREHLAQAFARFFMRVGLPVDIPRERLQAPSH